MKLKIKIVIINWFKYSPPRPLTALFWLKTIPLLSISISSFTILCILLNPFNQLLYLIFCNSLLSINLVIRNKWHYMKLQINAKTFTYVVKVDFTYWFNTLVPNLTSIMIIIFASWFPFESILSFLQSLSLSDTFDLDIYNLTLFIFSIYLLIIILLFLYS